MMVGGQLCVGDATDQSGTVSNVRRTATCKGMRTQWDTGQHGVKMKVLSNECDDECDGKEGTRDAGGEFHSPKDYTLFLCSCLRIAID